MKAWDFDAVAIDGVVLCFECLPEGLSVEDERVQPIFATDEWDRYPICDACGTEHDYIGLTTDGAAAVAAAAAGAGRTARFWVWENGGWVKLTLKPGEERAWYHSRRTEEGYAADCVTWTHTENGVLRRTEADGRDCDGRHSSCQTDLARFENLRAVPAWVEDGAPPDKDEKGQPLLRPLWEEEDPSRIFDEYAQAAGY